MNHQPERTLLIKALPVLILFSVMSCTSHIKFVKSKYTSRASFIEEKAVLDRYRASSFGIINVNGRKVLLHNYIVYHGKDIDRGMHPYYDDKISTMWMWLSKVGCRFSPGDRGLTEYCPATHYSKVLKIMIKKKRKGEYTVQMQYEGWVYLQDDKNVIIGYDPAANIVKITFTGNFYGEESFHGGYDKYGIRYYSSKIITTRTKKCALSGTVWAYVEDNRGFFE